jgi:NTP pyrophosphatase (non-canonical NTP hydrolase)
MDFDYLLKKIDEFDYHLNTKYPLKTEKEKIYARAVKINEEVGELCNEVLAYHNDQRNEKLDQNIDSKITKLNDEFADVIITTLTLAKAMNVDIKIALDNKIKKIDKRFKKIE